MSTPDTPFAQPIWQTLTRLGEAQILLPALLLACLWLVLRPSGRPLGLAWLVATVVAASLTTATKVVFIGYGLGWAPLDFTGISGHAMFAAAVLPLLLRLAASGLAPGWQTAALAAGFGLAGTVAVSRVMVLAHSWSEVLAGFALGGGVSLMALYAGPMPTWRLPPWVPAAVLAWAALGVAGAPPSRTHDWVTKMALLQSGRSQPYKRCEMQLDYQQRGGLPARPPGVPSTSMQPR